MLLTKLRVVSMLCPAISKRSAASSFSCQTASGVSQKNSCEVVPSWFAWWVEVPARVCTIT